MMKPMSMTACAVAFAAAVALAGCSDGAGSAAGSAGDAGAPSASQQAAEAVQIKQSPDKYTWYVKNYVGMNAGNAGYTGLDTIPIATTVTALVRCGSCSLRAMVRLSIPKMKIS